MKRPGRPGVPDRPSRLMQVHKWACVLAVFPGIPVAYLLKDSVAFVVLVSMYTVIMQHALGWQETRARAKDGPR